MKWLNNNKTPIKLMVFIARCINFIIKILSSYFVENEDSRLNIRPWTYIFYHWCSVGTGKSQPEGPPWQWKTKPYWTSMIDIPSSNSFANDSFSLFEHGRVRGKWAIHKNVLNVLFVLIPTHTHTWYFYLWIRSYSLLNRWCTSQRRKRRKPILSTSLERHDVKHHL